MASVEEKKKDWAEMSDGEEPEDTKEDEKAKITIKKKTPAAQKGFKNDRGDYVVTTINIPDMRSGVNKNDEDGNPAQDSDSDTSYGEETDAKATQVVEETKKEGKFKKVCLLYSCRKTSQKIVKERVEGS